MYSKIIASMLITISLAFSAIITVDNNIPSAGNYTSLQEAHDGANAGDTWQVFPSPTTYSGIDVTKPLTFVGVGYDLEDIPGQPENLKKTAKLTTMNFQEGSDNSLLMGFDNDTSNPFRINIYTSNITIERNKLTNMYVQGSNINIKNNFLINSMNINASNISNINIKNNFLKKLYCGNDADSTYNTNIFNNIFYDGSPSIEFRGGYYEDDANHNNWTIISNVCMGSISTYDDDNTIFFINNIINGSMSTEFLTDENSVVMYNISSSNTLPEGNGNLNNVDLSTVFVDYTNGDYHLATNSPALGAGEGGVDMGAYDGSYPFGAFVDNGIPAIPAIINLVSPYTAQQQNGLQIQITTKSNN